MMNVVHHSCSRGRQSKLPGIPTSRDKLLEGGLTSELCPLSPPRHWKAVRGEDAKGHCTTQNFWLLQVIGIPGVCGQWVKVLVNWWVLMGESGERGCPLASGEPVGGRSVKSIGWGGFGNHQEWKTKVNGHEGRQNSWETSSISQFVRRAHLLCLKCNLVGMDASVFYLSACTDGYMLSARHGQVLEISPWLEDLNFWICL
jgi:hypothetical protein